MAIAQLKERGNLSLHDNKATTKIKGNHLTRRYECTNDDVDSALAGAVRLSGGEPSTDLDGLSHAVGECGLVRCYWWIRCVLEGVLSLCPLPPLEAD